MTDELDVLVLENRAGAAAYAVATLEEAGHRVHRCHDANGSAFPCRALDGSDDCPLDHPVDVAVVVRHGVTPRPTYYEHGVLCANRNGLPIVAAGPDILDPFGPGVTERRGVDGDIEEGCRVAVTKGFEPLRRAVRVGLAPLLPEHGIAANASTCSIERRGGRLAVRVEIDAPIDARLEQSLAVRAFDAIRADGRRCDEVGVEVVGTPTA
jgi:hypothetical protein